MYGLDGCWVVYVFEVVGNEKKVMWDGVEVWCEVGDVFIDECLELWGG